MDNHNDVAAQLESDILEYEVKWDLGSLTMNKASGDDRIPPETSNNHKKTMLFKSCTQYISKFGKLSRGHRLENVFSFQFQISNAKECFIYHPIVLISHASMDKATATHSSTLAWKIPWT